MRLFDSFASVFAYMANQGMTWPSAISELIDNSFDAGATRVELRFSTSNQDRHWEVSDDGKGCPDISKMLPLGSHFDQGTALQPVGMWGVGLKDAWAFSGQSISIDTVCKGRRGVLQLSVSDVVDLTGPDPKYVDAKDSPSGTTVRLSMDRTRRAPKQETWDRIQWIFTPALSQGRQITVELPGGKRKIPLKPVETPPFVESTEDSFEVDGKQVSIAIGIVKDGYRMTNGPFWIMYGHRIIRHSTIGAGRYSTLRMGGKIILGKGWALTKNKDDLSDLSEELGDAIFSRIEPLLRKHERLSEDVESAALKAELETMLNDSIKAATKEKRNSPENQTGAVMPRASGRTRKNFSKTQPIGDGDSAKKRRGFSIDWMEDDGPMIGEFDGLANVVRLNVCHPFIQDAKAESNRPALYAVAVTLMSHTLCNSDPKGRVAQMLFERGSFPDTYANIMRTMKGKMEAVKNVA